MIPIVTPRAAKKASCLGSAPLQGIPAAKVVKKTQEPDGTEDMHAKVIRALTS